MRFARTLLTLILIWSNLNEIFQLLLIFTILKASLWILGYKLKEGYSDELKINSLYSQASIKN